MVTNESLLITSNTASPTTNIIRQFMSYVADGAQGYSENGKMSRRTAINYTASLFGAISYCNKGLDKEIQQQVLLWIENILTTELELNKRLVISKSTVYREDVSLIIRNL